MKFLNFNIFVLLMTFFCGFQANAQNKYKLMLQMSNYDGEAAYLVVSLINPKGEYEKTLAVMGSNKKWYKTLKGWHKAQQKKPEQLSAITGASISGGDRTTTILNLDNNKFDKGYTIRLESAVEHGKYNVEDAVIPLTTADFSKKTDGKGYVRFVKINKL